MSSPRGLTALTEALNSVSPDRRAFYHDHVLGGLCEVARKNLEGPRAVGTYEWQSDFASPGSISVSAGRKRASVLS